MENTSLRRSIYFEEIGDSNDIIFDYELALSNWNLKGKIRVNSNELKKTLKIEDIVQIKIKVLNSTKESDSFLRLYVYKTKQCDVSALNTKESSHALQVSLGNEAARSNWVSGESGFTAKVFLNDKQMLLNLVEDIVLDIQMFYFYRFDKIYKDFIARRHFSREKAIFLSELGLDSYLGYVKDSEYVSFASFCRKGSQREIDYNGYVRLWETFASILDKRKEKESTKNVKEVLYLHPKRGQLSEKKIEHILKNLPSGQYILVRTEKKPNKKKQREIIENRFGLKKWKTGRIKVVPIKYRYTYLKLIPYVSLYEIDWERKEYEK